jgi:hypothetical protein
VTPLVERALQPLDVVRGGLLRTVARISPLRRLVATRATRVPVLLSVHAAAAFAVALFVPSLSLALVPILLGVPHLVSDVRHLVVRRVLPGWWLRAVVAFAAALILLRVLDETRFVRAMPIVVEHTVGSAWILLAAFGGAMLGRRGRAALGALALAATVALLALAVPRAFRLAFVHGHNLLAIVIWLWLFRRRLSLAWPLIGLILLGGGVLASGALLATTINTGVLSLFGLHLFAAADWLAPGLPDRWALGLTTAFAFLQSVHYAIWLVAIPQEDARVNGTSTFRMAWRGLARDLGKGGLSISVGLTLVVLLGGVVAVARTRVLLLSLGTFHAWGELALLVFFIARGGWPWSRPGAVAGP